MCNPNLPSPDNCCNTRAPAQSTCSKGFRLLPRSLHAKCAQQQQQGVSSALNSKAQNGQQQGLTRRPRLVQHSLTSMIGLSSGTCPLHQAVPACQHRHSGKNAATARCALCALNMNSPHLHCLTCRTEASKGKAFALKAVSMSSGKLECDSRFANSESLTYFAACGPPWPSKTPKKPNISPFAHRLNCMHLLRSAALHQLRVWQFASTSGVARFLTSCTCFHVRSCNVKRAHDEGNNYIVRTFAATKSSMFPRRPCSAA